MARKRLGYNIKLKNEVFNDLTHFWTSQGYSFSGNTMQKGMQNQLLATADLHTHRAGKKPTKKGIRTKISLLSAFGKENLANTQFIRFENDNDKIIKWINLTKKGNQRVKIETTKFGYQPRQIVTVELFGTIIDIIQITDLIFSPFVKGQYKGKKGVEREVIVEGTKRVRIGTRTPTGLNDAQFWSSVFRQLKGDLIDEFFDKGFSQAGWSADADFITGIKSNADVSGNFPKNYTDLKR